MNYLVFALYIFFSATGLIMMKFGSGDLTASINSGVLGFTINFKMLIGMLFYILSFLLFIIIIPKLNLSFLYPLSAGILYVIIFIAGALLLGEKVTAIQIGGSVLILLGIIALSLGR